MVACAVSSCKRRSESSNFSKDGVSYHIFPKKSEIREQWTKYCRQNKGWLPSRTSAICSEHFTLESFQALPNNRRKLIENAIPTLKSCQCMDKDLDNDTPKASRASHVYQNRENPEIANMQELLQSQSRKIRRLQANNKLLKDKVQSLKKLLKKCQNNKK